MKTNSIIKNTAVLFSFTALFALPAHAVQNFNKTTSYATGDSNFGVVASFNAYDNYVKPTGPGTGSYSITASGSVTGKILGGSATALSGTGTVTGKTNGTGSFSGSLTALGYSLFNVNNAALPYTSQHFIKEWKADKTVHFTILLIPCDLTATLTASVDAYFRVDSPKLGTLLGMPRMEIKAGPVADVAATGTISGGVGIEHLAYVEMGVTGKVKLGKVALTASASVAPVINVNTSNVITATSATATTSGVVGATVNTAVVASALPATSTTSTTSAIRTVSTVPTATFVSTAPASSTTGVNGVSVTVSLNLSTDGITGTLDAWIYGELGWFSDSDSTNIASYSSGPASTDLLGPVTYTWF
jgi:hypothetical protein